jgi:membrane protease YdiL (CAAX protease family)
VNASEVLALAAINQQNPTFQKEEAPMSTLTANPKATFSGSTRSDISAIPQYRLGKILLIWAAAAIPMGVLGWLVAPVLARDAQAPGLVRLAAITAGLIWQSVLVLILLYHETGTLRWSTFSERLWLNTPRSPQTGEPRRRLWWWLVPLILVTALFQMQFAPILERIWVSLFPFMAEPQGYSLAGALATPEARAQLVGAWGMLALYVLSALFNTFLGEELLFRGLLLPRMAGVFGRWDWVINGLLFGLYHLHQPWRILSSAIGGILLYALPSRYFRSAGLASSSIPGKASILRSSCWGLCLDWPRKFGKD